MIALAMVVSVSVQAHETNVQELIDLGMDSGFAREIAESHEILLLTAK